MEASIPCLTKEATKPPSYNFLQQQERFDAFIEGYNNDRPHQALGGRYPGELYTPSPRQFFYPDAVDYLYHDRSAQVTQCGRICMGHRKISLSRVFAGQYVGVREVADEVWLAGRPDPSLMDYDLGFFDRALNRGEPVGVNPFAPEVSPMCSE